MYDVAKTIMMRNKDDPTTLDEQHARPYTRTSPPFEIGDGCVYVRFVHPLKLKIRTTN